MLECHCVVPCTMRYYCEQQAPRMPNSVPGVPVTSSAMHRNGALPALVRNSRIRR
jgi:hypothetical protein